MKKTFRLGGVHPEENKFAHVYPVEEFPIPTQAVVYMTQHLGAPATPVVQKGDKVKVGQLIGEGKSFMSANIHAPVSGTVSRIENVADFTGYKKPAIVIDTEGDEWDDNIDTSPDINRSIKLNREEIIARLKSCGVVGLGGACFPSHIKYMLKPEQKCEYLLINGAECEPYITADHRVMLERAEQCMLGIEAVLIASGARKAIIGIEENKPDAIAHLQKMTKHYSNIEIQPLKTKYPQGAEKQLIKAITGRTVPNGGLPIAVGCIVDNITTSYAIYEAVQKNKPIISTFTTVTGKSVKLPKNYHIRIGTPIMDIIQTVGMPEDTGKIISGGPMMGKAVSNLNAATAKGMSSILFMREAESRRGEVYPCLRCGKCVRACPMGLQPYLLQIFSEKNELEECEKLGIMNCMECGSCAYNCPSHRPLLDFIRVGKTKTGLLIKQRNSEK